jgi:hypothetical protein
MPRDARDAPQCDRASLVGGMYIRSNGSAPALTASHPRPSAGANRNPTARPPSDPLESSTPAFRKVTRTPHDESVTGRLGHVWPEPSRLLATHGAVVDFNQAFGDWRETILRSPGASQSPVRTRIQPYVTSWSREPAARSPASLPIGRSAAVASVLHAELAAATSATTPSSWPGASSGGRCPTPGELEVERPWNQLGQASAVGDIHQSVVVPMHDCGWHADSREPLGVPPTVRRAQLVQQHRSWRRACYGLCHELRYRRRLAVGEASASPPSSTAA